MKRTCLLAFVFLFFSFCLSAQKKDFVNELAGLFDKKGNEHYEWAGYNIYVEKINTPLKEKDYTKIRKKYKIKNSNEFSDPEINIPNHVIECITAYEINGNTHTDIPVHTIIYIFKDKEDKSGLIVFSKAGKRNLSIEKSFIDLYLNNKQSDYISPGVENINFAGRNIQLGNACRWKSPHNIYHGGGQVSWSVFDNAEDATEYIDLIMFKNNSNNSYIIEDSFIPVLFEGESVMAQRVVYGGYANNHRALPLVVYYVWTYARGKYISTILSHYGYNRNDYELPVLLTEFIQFESLPAWSWNKYDYPESEWLNAEQKEKVKAKQFENSFKLYFLNLKSGIYIPLGKQKDFTGESTYISMGFYFAGINNISSHSYADHNSDIFFDFGVVIPANKKRFDYYDKSETVTLKTDALFSVNLGYLHKKKIKPQLYLENHLKIGMAGISTNKKKPDKKDEYYGVNVFTMGLGTNIRYKRVGLFLDYQFAPYGVSKHLKSGGNSAISAGMNVVL